MLALDKYCTMANVKDVAVGKFFPEGRCKIGNLEDFNVELRHFKGDPLPATSTLEELHQTSNLKTLKAYIYTTPTSNNVNRPTELPAFEAESGPNTQATAEAGIDSGTPEVNVCFVCES